jgi:hypothetical protein
MPALLLPLIPLFAMQVKPPAETKRPSAIPKKMVELVDRARSVPPEFAADALLRIAESDAVTDTEAKKELIAEAFRKGGSAQEPMKRRGLRPGGGDTRVNFQARAFAQDLDALSLQSRAVVDMVKVDKPKARELFQQIPSPRVPKLTCADMLVYDVSAYYEALAEVAAKTFTAKERAEDAHAKFLAGFAGGISSAVEVGPMARALAAVNLTPDQLLMASTAFAASLKSMAADDRSFSYTVSFQGSTLQDLGALVASCKRQQVSTAGLADAARSYMARHLGGKRCADTGGITVGMGIGGGGTQPTPADAVTYFNTTILGEVYPPGTVIAPLGGDEIRASGVEDPIEPEPEPKSKELSDLIDRYNGLLFNPLGTSWSNEQKTETVWQTKLREYMALLADWKPGEAIRPAEYFYRKCYLLSSLINVAPSGPARELVLRGYVDFLQQNGYQQGSRIEWFLPLNTLLFRVLTEPALAGLADEMRNSGDAIVALYAQLGTLAPASPAKIMPLICKR